MMLPEIINNHIARIEEKKSIIMDPIVISSLNKFEMIAAKASIGNPIMTYSEEELRNRVAMMVLLLLKDLGIKTSDMDDLQYYSKRFFETLRDYYSNFTLNQVDKAFQLLLCGALDEYLPKDKHGNPDRNHYQSFSLEFISKVLRAFQQYNNRVWSKAQKALPEPEKIVTDEEKQEIHDNFLMSIQEQYEKWEKGEDPNFMFNVVVAEYFISREVVEDRELTQEDFNKALLNIKDIGSLTGIEKAKIFERFRFGEHHDRLKHEANKIKCEKLIIKAFETIKIKGKKIYEKENII